jgi:hexosaminidase
LLDVARHYMPVDQIEREIDGLAAVKLNVLHLHLSDDQSFRIESKKFPQLVNKSSHGQYYTRADIKRLVSYAQDRGVRIIPEFDVPGHSTAWLATFPELAVSPADGSEPFVRFGGYKNTLDPSNPKLLKALDKLFGEMAALFPDEYFHIGGDEVDYSYWKVSPSVAKLKQQRKLADERAVQTYFNTQIEKILHKHGKKMVGWNEILHADLPKTTVVHSWTGVGALQEAVTRGYPVICSLDYYLDWYMPASFHYGIDPLRPNPETFETLMQVVPGGKKSKGLQEQKKQALAFRPSPEAERLVLGGEAAQWTELAAPWSIDTVLWPRLAAIAERLWSPADVKDPASLYRRFDALKLELSDLGITPDEDLRKLRVRLSGSDEGAQTLADFAETLEPVKYYTSNARQREAKAYDLNSPLNRLVDTVPAESASARQFAAVVTRYLKGRTPEDLAYLKASLARWDAAAQRMADLAKTNARLSEALPLVDSLRAAYKSAAEALDYLESSKQAPASWTELQRVALNPESKNDSDLKPAITLDVQRLMDAATSQSGNSDVRASSRQ